MHIKDTFPELYKIRRQRPLKPAEVRSRLDGARGREYWRSLEELAETPEFAEFLHSEFPRQAAEWDASTDRRTFIKLMGASLALAGLTGCSYQPPETAISFVRQPEEMVPGKPLYFATAMPLGGAATGLLVRSNAGRPTKIEGNPDHPASLGATDIFSQAAVLSLYDPDRSQTVINRGEVRSYTAFLGEMSTALESQRPTGGAGLRFLTETVISPTLASQLADVKRRFPAMKWHQYEPAGGNSAAVGARLATGDFAGTVYRFEGADRVLSLDSDFLSCGPASLRSARDFANRRRVRQGLAGDTVRLYAVESTPTNTGMLADHRLSVRPSEVEGVARAVAAALGASGAQGPAGAHADWAGAVAADLREHAGRSIVIAGDEQPPAVHALAHVINGALGNAGKTVLYTDPVEEHAVNQLESLRELVTDIDAGAVRLLVIVGGNPVYSTPLDLRLDETRMKKVPLCVHLSQYEDETSELCHWHIPEAHFLEAWSDARAFDGTATIMQPLIAPLYNGKSAHELLAAFSERPDRPGYDIVREHWQRFLGRGDGSDPQVRALFGGAQQQSAAPPTPSTGPQAAATPAPAATGAAQGPPRTAANTPAAAPTPAPSPSPEFERQWRKVVHDGVVPGTARKERGVSVRAEAAGAAAPPPAGGRGYEIVFRPDPSIYDGRFANNGWLQELPKPITKLTWDNAAIISPATAEKLGLGATPDGALLEGMPRRVNRLGGKGGETRADVVKLRFKGREVSAPVWIQAGQPDDVVTVHLGYGRWRVGRVGGHRDSRVGFNAYELRASDAYWFGTGAEVQPTGDVYQLASTQIHFGMEGRDIVRSNTLEFWRRDPTLKPDREDQSEPPQPAGENREPYDSETMYPNYEYNGYKWGMAIDLGTCVGCNACIVACQAENNIPVVGKEQVARSREMHWLRVDAYYRGAMANPEGVYFMPVPCMHCENAPCEPVCPVHATVHSAEGTNDMVYNRCVGTRYCSNNCPYKVRRFNFLLYQDWNTPSLKMVRNPEVSVRSRGVMEKCTYCIQRIEYAKIEAEKERRRVRDGEIMTACQAACPTETIVFGDLNDHESRVFKMKQEPRDYALLADLNTRPRTTYLASVRNPNPALERKG